MAATDEKILNGKGLEQLWSLVKAETAKGAKIATGSYVGTGTYGASNPCTLTFDFIPKYFGIFTEPTSMYTKNLYVGIWNKTTELCIAPDGSFSCVVSYSGTSVSWYERNSSWTNASATYQANSQGKTYFYFAIS